eukprot:3226972-Amphidinium_carterae.2
MSPSQRSRHNVLGVAFFCSCGDMEGQLGGSARMPSISCSLKVLMPRSGVNMASGSVRTPAVVGGSGTTSSMSNRPYCVVKAEVCRLCQSFAVESTPEGREPTTRLSRNARDSLDCGLSTAETTRESTHCCSTQVYDGSHGRNQSVQWLFLGAVDTPKDDPDANSCALQWICRRTVTRGSTKEADAGIASSCKVALRLHDTTA